MYFDGDSCLGYNFYSSQLFQKDVHSPICIGALRLASRASRASPDIVVKLHPEATEHWRAMRIKKVKCIQTVSTFYEYRELERRK